MSLIELLDDLEGRKLAEDCDFSSFCCGNEPVDEFVQTEMLNFQNENLGITYVWFRKKQPIAFVTISMSDLRKESMTSEDRPPIGKENYPALLIGQLGVHKEYQDRGVGTFLLLWCQGKARKMSEDVGCRFLILHSEDSKVKWYEDRGFRLIPNQTRREKLMFLNIFPEQITR